VSKCRHLTIFRRQQTDEQWRSSANFAPGAEHAYVVEMVNQRLDTANQLVSELRKRIKTFARAAESALAQSTYDVKMLALHEQRIAALQDKVDELIAIVGSQKINERTSCAAFGGQNWEES
jgi:hypothetical protein